MKAAAGNRFVVVTSILAGGGRMRHSLGMCSPKPSRDRNL
jgi:hypothetical protein